MKKKNNWRNLFVVLLSFNILVLIGIGMIFFLAIEQDDIPLGTPSKENRSEFTIRTEKEDLTKLINHYIEKEGLNGPIDYTVLLTDDVELYGEVKVFSQSMQLKMTFEPRALQNGDL